MKRSHIFTVAIAGLFLTAASPQHQTRLHANLIGFHEVPANSTVASGDFTAEISSDETTIHYKLTYSGLEGTVTQAHIHFGQRFVAAGISLWLCQVPPGTNDPAGLAPACPQEAIPNNPVEGDLTFHNLVGPAGQGIDGTPDTRTPEEFAEIIKAIRAGLTYANVHSSKFPSGEIRGQIRVLNQDNNDHRDKHNDDHHDERRN
jgi:CHRD domain-containing protein